MTRTFVFCICIIGFLLYLPSLFGGFLWDDEDFVYANTYVAEFRIDKFFSENVTAGRGKPSNYFRPIQLSMYALVHLFFGFTPQIYHAVNIVFHIGSALAVFYFFLFFAKQKIIAFLTALAFLIHPVQTEAVSYVSGLSDPLYVLFGFMSLIMFLRFLKDIKQDKYYVLCLLSFISYILTLLSKESGLVFLPLLFLLVIIRREWRNVFLVIPYGLVSLFYIVYHFTVINVKDMHSVWGNNLYSNSVIVRLVTFVYNLRDYFLLLVFPKDLFMERDFTVQIQTTFLSPWIIMVVFINAGLLVLLFLKRRSLKYFPTLLFCYLGFFISFLPTSGIVLINGIFYEHFLYLPMVFFFAFWFFLIEKYLKKPLFLLFGAIGVMWVIRSLARQYEWADPVRLYEQTLHFAPKSVRVRNNLAMTLAERGEIDRAIAEYKIALKIDSRVPNMYHNLANIYRSKGEYTLAEEYYRKAIEVNPAFSFSYASLLSMFQELGDDQKATEMERRINERFPDSGVTNSTPN